MARPAFAELTPITEGDEWDGIAVTFSSTGTIFASNLAAVEMEFTDSAGIVGLTLSTAGNDIVIDDANAWEITVSPQVLTLTAGRWTWKFTTTDAAGIPKTRLVGAITIL